MQYSGFFLLQAAAAPSAQTNPLMSFLPLIFIVAIFYFLVFMPMQKQKKQQAAMLSSLQTGTDVLTTGGIVGTIVSITDSVRHLSNRKRAWRPANFWETGERWSRRPDVLDRR